MAYSFQEIVNLADSGKTGREVAVLIGITQPVQSTIEESRYLMNTGNRITADAREEVAAGNGHGLYGTKRRSNGNGGNGKKAVDPLYTIEDEEIVMAARLAAKKAGIGPTGNDVREAIESENAVFIRFIDMNLSPEQREILEKAVGVLTPAEREKKRRDDLIGKVHYEASKAMKLDSMRKELEAAGFLVEAPLWFSDASNVDLKNIESFSTSYIETIADKITRAGVAPRRLRKDVEAGVAAILGH